MEKAITDYRKSAELDKSGRDSAVAREQLRSLGMQQ